MKKLLGIGFVFGVLFFIGAMTANADTFVYYDEPCYGNTTYYSSYSTPVYRRSYSYPTYSTSYSSSYDSYYTVDTVSCLSDTYVRPTAVTYYRSVHHY